MRKIIVTTPEELQHLIIPSVRTALTQRLEQPDADDTARNSGRYLTVAEAAGYLNLAKQTLYDFTSSHNIPFIKRAKRLLFVKEELDAWLARGKKPSVQQIRAGLK